jgi:hypothetical protein
LYVWRPTAPIPPIHGNRNMMKSLHMSPWSKNEFQKIHVVLVRLERDNSKYNRQK